MQVSPLSQQNFEGYKFFKVPQELQETMLKNVSFQNLARDYDVFVTATPKRTFKDPFCLREPKVDEKSRLTCELKKENDEWNSMTFNVYTESNFFAPLKEHVDTLLKQLEEFDFSTRVNRLIYGAED